MLQGLEAEIEVAEEERAQAVGSHVEGLEQLFRLQEERLGAIQRTFNEELEVPLLALGELPTQWSPELAEMGRKSGGSQ